MYCRKFSTETGARSLYSSTVIDPAEVSITTTGLPGAGCSGAAGAGAWRRNPSKAKRIGISIAGDPRKIDQSRTLVATEHRVSGNAPAPKESCAMIQPNGSLMLEAGALVVNDAALQLRLFAGGHRW